MPMAYKKGQSVRQKVIPITGPIVSVGIVDDVVQYEVAYTDADGHAGSRFFTEEQLEAVAEVVAPDAPAAE